MAASRISPRSMPAWQRLPLPGTAVSRPPLRDGCSLAGRPLAETAADLRAYLADHLGAPSLRFLRNPVLIPDGWETHIYQFELAADEPLPPSFRRELILRVFASRQGVPRARHEFAVLKHMRRLGYPVPEPVCFEEECALFGGPFLILERIPGPMLLQVSVRQPWMVFPVACQMATMHTRLHELPIAGFPGPSEPLLPRSLGELHGIIQDYALDGLTNGLDWLRSNQPPPPAAPSILHLDFHPLNLVRWPRRGWYVLDWTEAAIGDSHADLGVSTVLMACTDPRSASWWERATIAIGRSFLSRMYRRSYAWQRPVDRARLHYYQAWAAFRQLTRFGRWLVAGPEITGCKPELLSHLQGRNRQALRRYFERHTGVAVALPTL